MPAAARPWPSVATAGIVAAKAGRWRRTGARSCRREQHEDAGARTQSSHLHRSASSGPGRATALRWGSGARRNSDAAREIDKDRAATAECVNAQARNRGLLRMPVRGLAQVRCVVRLYVLAHNLITWPPSHPSSSAWAPVRARWPPAAHEATEHAPKPPNRSHQGPQAPAGLSASLHRPRRLGVELRCRPSIALGSEAKASRTLSRRCMHEGGRLARELVGGAGPGRPIARRSGAAQSSASVDVSVSSAGPGRSRMARLTPSR